MEARREVSMSDRQKNNDGDELGLGADSDASDGDEPEEDDAYDDDSDDSEAGMAVGVGIRPLYLTTMMLMTFACFLKDFFSALCFVHTSPLD